MMRYTFVLIAALASGCDDDGFEDDFDDDIDENNDDDNDDDGDPPPPGVLRWRAAITAYSPYGAIAGDATVQMTNGVSLFVATVALRNDSQGNVRPWHVHFGTCNSGGDIVGEDGDYPRLLIDNDGTAEAEAIVDEALTSGAAYHVNIHQSDAFFSTIIACGDLMRE